MSQINLTLNVMNKLSLYVSHLDLIKGNQDRG